MFLLLLSGGNASIPAYNSSNSNASTQHSEKKLQIKFTKINQPCIVIEESDVNGEVEYFINEEDEDENVNKAPNKKSKTINNCYLAFSDIFILGNPHNNYNGSRPFYSPSNKYISQRTLRI